MTAPARGGADGSGDRPLWGRTAAEIAELVRARRVTAEQVLVEHLGRIDEREPALNAFAVIGRVAALEEARSRDRRDDLDRLPLAGVPVAVKDDVDVAGLPTRKGSLATAPLAVEADDTMVARLRRAGAVVVGKTNAAELAAWPFTETLAFGVTRNPWRLDRTPGGSSGGSAAAVAGGMVPIAVGSDSLGSIRIPAACCGLVGIKPGTGLVPRPRGAGHAWFGMTEHGPLATCVEDVALTLSVMAGDGVGSAVQPPTAPLRVATSTRPPLPGIPVARADGDAVATLAGVLEAAGHTVTEADPPYPSDLVLTVTRRWDGAIAADATGLDRRLLSTRIRRKARAGRLVQRMSPSTTAEADEFRELMDAWFRGHDVLLTPVLARAQLRVGALHRRGWLASNLVSARFAPFPAPWNLSGYPAVAVPAGATRGGLPVGVQLVAPRGREDVLLGLASQLELLRPWPRLAPDTASVNPGGSVR